MPNAESFVPFKGLKIIELAGVLAGPAVGMFFAELGAQVIKIENKHTAGDMTRKWKLPSEDPDQSTSAYFSAVNCYKDYRLKDLSDPEDQKEIHALVEDADVVLTNFKSGSAVKYRMDYATLSELNPKLIYGAITGFISEPEKVAFDLVLQAETGFMYMNGTEESGPVKMPVALIDVLAAHQLKEGILIALLQKSQTGKGALVTVSLEESALASLANQASNYLMEGFVPQRLGSLHPNIAPYGEIVTTKDHKQLVLAIGTDKQFSHFCAIIDRPDLPSDPAFATNSQRVKHRKKLLSMLIEKTKNIESKALLEACLKAKVPMGQINNMAQVMKNPVAQKMVIQEKIQGSHTKRLSSVAFAIKPS